MMSCFPLAPPVPRSMPLWLPTVSGLATLPSPSSVNSCPPNASWNSSHTPTSLLDSNCSASDPGDKDSLGHKKDDDLALSFQLGYSHSGKNLESTLTPPLVMNSFNNDSMEAAMDSNKAPFEKDDASLCWMLTTSGQVFWSLRHPPSDNQRTRDDVIKADRSDVSEKLTSPTSADGDATFGSSENEGALSLGDGEYYRDKTTGGNENKNGINGVDLTREQRGGERSERRDVEFGKREREIEEDDERDGVVDRRDVVCIGSVRDGATQEMTKRGAALKFGIDRILKEEHKTKCPEPAGLLENNSLAFSATPAVPGGMSCSPAACPPVGSPVGPFLSPSCLPPPTVSVPQYLMPFSYATISAGNAAAAALTSRAYHYRLAPSLSLGQNLPLQSMRSASLRAGLNLPLSLPTELNFTPPLSLNLSSSLQAGILSSSQKTALNLPQYSGSQSMHPRSAGELHGAIYLPARGALHGGVGGLSQGHNSLHLSGLGGARSMGGFNLQQFALQQHQQQQQQQHAFHVNSRHSDFTSLGGAYSMLGPGRSASPSSHCAGGSGGGGGGGQSKKKRSWSRAVFSNLQRKGLEKRFDVQKYVTKPDRRQLAAMLGLTDAQVKVWFQNRRMKWRHQEEAAKKKKDEDAKRQSSTKPLPPSSSDFPQAPPSSDPWPRPTDPHPITTILNQLPGRLSNPLPVEDGRCSPAESDDDLSVGDVTGEIASDDDAEEEHSRNISSHVGNGGMGERVERENVSERDDWELSSMRRVYNGGEAIVRNSNIVSVSDILDLRKPTS